MATREHIREAVIAYCKRRGQMGSRKAAAHVMQEYGVTSSELAEALADERLRLIDRSSADEPENGDA